jgi:glycopeptide antibiotics resistance protein
MVLLALVLSPSSRSASAPVRVVVDGLGALGAPGWLAEPRMWGYVFNVVLFVPVGWMGAVARPRWPLPRWLLVGLLVSGAIELTQGLLLPGRDADPLDVLTNTAGTVLGAWLAQTWRSRARS